MKMQIEDDFWSQASKWYSTGLHFRLEASDAQLVNFMQRCPRPKSLVATSISDKECLNCMFFFMVNFLWLVWFEINLLKILVVHSTNLYW